MKQILLIILCCLSFTCYAQEEKFYRNEFQLNLGLNTQDAWEVELGYSFLFHKYVGLTFGLSIMDQMFEYLLFSDDDDIYERWRTRESRGYASALLLRPAVRFRLPLLRDNKEDILLLNIEPGLLLNMSEDGINRNVSYRGPKWLFSQIKGYLTIDLDRLLFSLGVALTNFDINSGKDNYNGGISSRKYVREKVNTVSFLASISYRF